MTLTDELLHASLLCNMRPEGPAAYRVQLFFIANKDLGSSNHQNDYQRSLETAVERDDGYWTNYGQKGSGEYQITGRGYSLAKSLFQGVEPLYEPVGVAKFLCTIQGNIAGVTLTLRLRKNRTEVLVNGDRMKGTEACCVLEGHVGHAINTKGTSAPRVLYDLAVDHRLRFTWGA